MRVEYDVKAVGRPTQPFIINIIFLRWGGGSYFSIKLEMG